MSYARKIEDLIAERDELRRWKSTHAPRIEALEGLLKHAQLEAHTGREAIATLASEREANAILTAEVERLRAALAQSCDEHRSNVYEAGPGGGCILLADSVAAERKRLSAVIAEWEKLRDPHTLHVNLLRGFPAMLSRSVLLHLAGDEEPKF